jgi:serine/threonine protein kinase
MTGNIGTIFWMAPEMLQSTQYTEKVDVYSYGIILFELLTGEIPFANENGFALPLQIIKGVRPVLPKNIHKKWQKLVTVCWHDKPSKRPSFDKVVETLMMYQEQHVTRTG